MKIQKKYAITLVDFILDYLEAGYYPVDDTVNESAIISQTFGFATHHSLMETKLIADWVAKRELPKVVKTARIDLTSAEGCAILSMMAECLGKDVEASDKNNQLQKYLDKEFVIHADDAENTEG